MSDLPRYILRNCTVFIDRESKIGQASEMQTPNIRLQYEDMRNAGMNKARPVLMGFEVEDADIKMTALDPQVLAVFGGPVGTEIELMIVGDLRDEADGAQNSATYYTRGKLSELDFDNWQPGQPASHGYMFKPTYGKLEIGDRVLIEWDDFDLTVAGNPVFRSRAALLA